jgi:hypothetical protein
MRIILLLALLVIAAAMPARSQTRLDSGAVISLVTYDPSEGAVFTVYGHTAIRVKDPANGIDSVFNYGIFDFSESNFIYRFTKGETDYKLGVVSFRHLLAECSFRGCGAREQVLNLLPAEKQSLWEALLVNARPENATYRYNFFYDNCATRPLLLIEKHVRGRIEYGEVSERHSFRRLINHCMRNNPWLIFGTELALGSPTDRLATPREELFLPLYLEAAFAGATIVDANGSRRRLVSSTGELAKAQPGEIKPPAVSPLGCSLLFLGAVILLTLWERKRKSRFCLLDFLLLAIAGLGGSLIFFLAFISVHPATWPNYIIIWLHPVHLLGAVLMLMKRYERAARIYLCADAVLIIVLLTGMPFIPQSFNVAVIPMMLAFVIRAKKP